MQCNKIPALSTRVWKTCSCRNRKHMPASYTTGNTPGGTALPSGSRRRLCPQLLGTIWRRKLKNSHPLRQNKTPKKKKMKEKQSCFNTQPQILRDEIPNCCLTLDGPEDKWHCPGSSSGLEKALRKESWCSWERDASYLVSLLDPKERQGYDEHSWFRGSSPSLCPGGGTESEAVGYLPSAVWGIGRAGGRREKQTDKSAGRGRGCLSLLRHSTTTHSLNKGFPPKGPTSSISLGQVFKHMSMGRRSIL